MEVDLTRHPSEIGGDLLSMAGKREEQMKAITERLEQGVQELFTSEKYTKYLKAMSQFHHYSFNNTLLIAMQKPEATLVASYGTWNKKFHRQVKRGEKGIKIIAPIPIRQKEEIEKLDPETNEPVLRPDGQPETEETWYIVPRFRETTVFDISQTYGDPFPELDTPELMGSVENFPIFMEAIRSVSPVPMRYAEIDGEAKGYYSSAKKEIVIQDGMSEKQAMKTAVHEVTHAMCHDRDIMEELGEKKDRMTKEVEAESVAFTVCSFFGLDDVSDYSFPYIAGWCSGKDMKELRSSMDFIRKTAGSFIDDMVENIQKLQKEKEANRELGEDDLVFQISLLGEETKTFYLVDNVGRVDFLRLLQDFADQKGEDRSPVRFLKEHGVHLDLWKDSENPERNEDMPDFYDVLYIDMDHIVDASKFSTLIQVEQIISRAEYGHTALDREAHNLAVRHAYKLDDLRETKKLVEAMIEAAENPGIRNMREIMEDAQAEIDFLPDNAIGLMQMHEFGYRNDSVLPLTMERAVALHHAGLHIYSLHEDGSSTLMNTELDILEAGGIFGVDARAWDSYLVMESVRERNKEKEEQTDNILEGGIMQEKNGNEHKEEMSEEYEEVEIFEIPALFSNGRITDGDVPDGFYRYDLRGSGDDPGDPVSMENRVIVNHAGTILTMQPLPIPERGFLNLGEELNFTGGISTPEQFRQYLTGMNFTGLEEKMQDAVIGANEELLYTDTVDRYAIFQIDENGKGREYLFFNMDFIQRKGMEVEGGDYELIYSGRLGQQEDLNTIYEKFNLNHPEGYTGHSLSVSDIVVMNRGGHVSAHFVDSFGFTELPDFVRQREKIITERAALTGQDIAAADDRKIYQEVKIFEIPALFSKERIPDSEIPERFVRYELRGSNSEPGNPLIVEEHAESDFAGTLLSVYGLQIPERGYLKVGKEFRFVDRMSTVEQFIQSQIEPDGIETLDGRRQNAVIRANEELLYTDMADRYAIFQINEETKGREYILTNRDDIKKYGFEIDGADYSFIYGGIPTLTDSMDSICEKITASLPEGYEGNYPGEGNVIVMNRGGKVTACFIDIYGYMELPDFIRQREQLIERESMRSVEEATYPPLYPHTIEYAMEHGRADDCLESRKLNLDCKKAVENAIRENFDGMHLKQDAAESVLKEYGAQRVTFILANTVQRLEHDGRFSRDTKEWAKGFTIPENISRGMDLNADYIVDSHPAVLDGFIGLSRDIIREQEKQRETEIQIDIGTKGFTVDGHFGTWHTAGMKVIGGEAFYLMEHDEYKDSVAAIIVNQNGTLVAEDLEHGFDQGAKEAIREYLAEKGKVYAMEMPFIAQYYVIADAHGEGAEKEFQYFPDFEVAIDVYQRIPNHKDKEIGMESIEQPPTRMSLIVCQNGIETLTNIEFCSLSGKWVLEETMEASRKAGEYLDNCDTELAYQTGKGYFSIQTVSDGYDYTFYSKDFREIDGGVYDNRDVSIQDAMHTILEEEGMSLVYSEVMDYEELQEKVDAVAQEELQKARKGLQETQEEKKQEEEKEPEKMLPISDRTEPETALNGRSCADIEETVLCYAQAQIDEMGLADEVKLLGARVYGSRSREGLYKEGSDIDVAVSYSGDFREDAFFKALHEDGLTIAGIPVDINPISTEKTGTLEEYLESAEKYLDEKQNNMEIGSKKVETEQEAGITFYVAECSEFPVLGEYHERLETLQEAMELYDNIPSERMNGIKEIGFCLEDGSIYDGMPHSLMAAGEVQKELINEIPHYKDSALVQKTIVDMETLLSERAEQDMQKPEIKVPEPGKTAETTLKTDKGISGISKKQSVLNALRERQARLKAQDKEKQGQKSQSRKKGGQEL